MTTKRATSTASKRASTKRRPAPTSSKPDTITIPDLDQPLLGAAFGPGSSWQAASWPSRLLMLAGVGLSGLIGGSILASILLYSSRVVWPTW